MFFISPWTRPCGDLPASQKGPDAITVVAGEANAQYPSIAPLPGQTAARLVYQERRRDHNIWGLNLSTRRDPYRVVASTWPDEGPALSFAGRRFAFISASGKSPSVGTPV